MMLLTELNVLGSRVASIEMHAFLLIAVLIPPILNHNIWLKLPLTAYGRSRPVSTFNHMPKKVLN